MLDLTIFKHKSVQIGLGIYISYIIMTFLGYFFQIDFRWFNRQVFALDFTTFYQAADYFLNDLSILFTDSSYDANYRYLPTSSILYLVFLIVPLQAAYIINTIFIFMANLANCILIWHISKDIYHASDQNLSDLKWMLGSYLALPLHLVELALGQNLSYLSFFLLLTFYYFHQKPLNLKYSLLGGLFFTIAISYKPLILGLAPFLLIIDHSKRIWIDLKNSIVRFIPLAVLFFLNVIIFVLYPDLWRSFIILNFEWIPKSTESFSLSQFLYNYFDFNFSLTFIILFGSFTILLFLRYIRQADEYIHFFTFGLMTGFLSYYQTWFFYLLYIGIFFIISITITPRKNKRKSVLWWYILSFSAIINLILIPIIKLNIITPLLFTGFFIFCLKIIFIDKPEM